MAEIDVVKNRITNIEKRMEKKEQELELLVDTKLK